MNKTIDYFIDSKNDLASFEYYFEEYLNIKSVTLKSIMFYIAHVDIKKGIIFSEGEKVAMVVGAHHLAYLKEINLKNLCDFMNEWLTAEHVK